MALGWSGQRDLGRCYAVSAAHLYRVGKGVLLGTSDTLAAGMKVLCKQERVSGYRNLGVSLSSYYLYPLAGTAKRDVQITVIITKFVLTILLLLHIHHTVPCYKGMCSCRALIINIFSSHIIYH